MTLRRPGILQIEFRERSQFSLDDLLAGGAGVVTQSEWIALAPHIGKEMPLEFGDLAVFEALATGGSMKREALEAAFGAARVERLASVGLLIGDGAGDAELRERDDAMRTISWWGPAAVAHTFGRWQGIDVAADEARSGKRTLQGMIDRHGPPPPETIELRPRESWQPLPPPVKTPLDELLAARATCRNFDPSFHLPLQELASLLHRVFGAQATQVLGAQTVALKKNSPSGGGLHPIEAFVLVQRVDGLAPGCYHYHTTGHALEPISLASGQELAIAACELVAGQSWFANAPVLLLMAARFQRTYWKYRNHSKAWRVIQLDAGHLSQNLYLSATELGYGAFITGAINDDCAERLFELDGFSTGAIAACGFGRRASSLDTIEFDPLGKVTR